MIWLGQSFGMYNVKYQIMKNQDEFFAAGMSSVKHETQDFHDSKYEKVIYVQTHMFVCLFSPPLS